MGCIPLLFPLVFQTAFGQQEQVFDHLPDGDLAIDLKHAGHGLDRPNPVVGVSGDRVLHRA